MSSGVCQTPNSFFPVRKDAMLAKDAMKGKIALVTGGGTGLGRAIATAFAKAGASVVIAARRQAVLEAAAAEMRTETGGAVYAVPLDVRDQKQVESALDECEKLVGLPNVLVNNAAGNFIMATERLSSNAIATVVDIVLLGTVRVTRELGKRAMERGKSLSVLSITTPYARHGAPFVVPSAIAKSGVENLTRSLAAEWTKHGVRLNVIAPGPIPTEGAFGRLSTLTLEQAAELAAQRVPEGRCGATEELANLAAYVCSDYASWLNGAIIDFDGGQQYLNHSSSFGEHLHDMQPEDWQKIEETIRGRTGKAKPKI